MTQGNKKYLIFAHHIFNKLQFLKFLLVIIISLFILAFAGCTESPAAQAGDDSVERSQQQEGATGTEETVQKDNQQEQASGSEAQDEPGQAEESIVADVPAALSQEPSGNFSADGKISDGEYSGYADIEGFEIYWASDSEYIYMAMKAETSGFVAVGIQPGNMMKDADMIFGFVDNISVAIYDMYSTGNFGPHPPDIELGGTDDILDFDGSEQDGHTIIEFKRLLSTGDEYDNEILPGENKIIWSYGNSDTPDGSHSKRGYGQIEIK